MNVKQNVFISDLCALGGDFDKNIEQFAAAGFGHVELMMDGPIWEEYISKKGFLAAMRRHPVRFSLHGPCYDVNLTSENKAIRNASLESCLEAVLFAAESGCSHLVIHPGYCHLPFDKVHAARRSKEMLAVLCGRAREAGVRLAVENVGVHGSSLYTYEEFVHLLDDCGDAAGYLLDIGHALINGWGCASLIRNLSGRLLAIHIHDNNGLQDQHLPIGRGIAPWSDIFREIAALPRPCSIVLEYGYGTPLPVLVESKQMLEAKLAAT